MQKVVAKVSQLVSPISSRDGDHGNFHFTKKPVSESFSSYLLKSSTFSLGFAAANVSILQGTARFCPRRWQRSVAFCALDFFRSDGSEIR